MSFPGPVDYLGTPCGELVSKVRAGIGRYLDFYNTRRPHSSLDGKTPDQAYFNQPMLEAAAA